MVEFCSKCNVALPKADITIKDGKLYISPDYVCPECGNLASPVLKEKPDIPEPSQDYNIIIKRGFIIKEE